MRTIEGKKIQLMALLETVQLDKELRGLIKNKTFLHSGTEEQIICHCIASLACREEAGSVFHPVSEHILRTKIKTPFGHTSIIAVYAPTKPTTANEVTILDESYQQLHATLAVIPTRDMVNIMGYFHARVGSDNGMWKKVIGSHSPDQ